MPVTMFGIVSVLAGPPLTTTSNSQGSLAVLARFTQTFSWVWINVLAFSISNQRSPDSILEDSINKPWRPIPAGKITAAQAGRLHLAAMAVGLSLIVLYLGAIEETVICFVGTWIYNDLGGANDHFVVRNFLNGIAYIVYCSGAMRVACGSSQVLANTPTYRWLIIIGFIVFTTMQVQDLKDQLGDRERNRHTAPLVIGDIPSRWSIAIGVSIWTIICSMYWNLNLSEFMLPFSFGILVAVRVLVFRTSIEDRTTYLTWCFWLISLFFLPLIKSFNTSEVLSSFFSGLVNLGLR
jgi:hypothetical protein